MPTNRPGSDAGPPRRRRDTTRGECLHCKRLRHLRPRQLCSRCFGSVEVRALYPVSESSSARRGVAGGNQSHPLPMPTSAMPGSEGKIRVLAERAAAGERLWHPDDAKLDAREVYSGVSAEDAEDW